MNEQLEEEASLYVLELLEPKEAVAFEAQIARDEELRRYVDELRETTAKYAHSVPMRFPPLAMEGRILSAIRDQIQPNARGTSSAVNWLPWALAACLAIACVLLANDRLHAKKQIARLEKRNAMAEMQIATLASKLSSAPNASAVVLWDSEKQEGILKVANVPATDPDQDYQLWIVDPETKQPIDAGVFSVSSDGTKKIPFKPKARVSSANAFAVSLERKGGVPKAEGPMVLVGK